MEPTDESKPRGVRKTLAVAVVLFVGIGFSYIFLGLGLHLLLLLGSSAGAIVAIGCLLLAAIGFIYQTGFPIEKILPFRGARKLDQIRSGVSDDTKLTKKSVSDATFYKALALGMAVGGLAYWLPVAFNGAL